MIIFNNTPDFKNHLRKLKNDNITIGFVPTMGALHNGHTSLIKKSVLENDYSVVSIFINPTQFNNINDYESYPINISRDIELLDSISENIILFRPDTEEIYSGKVVSDSYDFGDLDKYMEGEHRKGHFQGVATVVHKLFEIVTADNVYFGEKDFQQLRIIEDLVLKIGLKLKITRCETIRQNDGLALSSRNKKLDISSQNIATNLFKALSFAKKNFDTLDLEIIYAKVEDLLQNFPQISVDYFAIADENDLKPIKHKKKNQKYRAFIAADISGVRLIDNIKLYWFLMNIEILKSKIHRVKVTGADLNYIGSITIDKDLMDAANIIEGEKIQILNNNNGERLETYVIPGSRGSGEITVNGAAARKVSIGDILILITYASMSFDEAKNFKPSIIFPNEENNLLK